MVPDWIPFTCLFLAALATALVVTPVARRIADRLAVERVGAEWMAYLESRIR